MSTNFEVIDHFLNICAPKDISNCLLKCNFELYKLYNHISSHHASGFIAIGDYVDQCTNTNIESALIQSNLVNTTHFCETKLFSSKLPVYITMTLDNATFRIFGLSY